MEKQRLSRRDLLIILLLVLATASVVGYRQWVAWQRRTDSPLDFGGLPGIVVVGSIDCGACIAQQGVIDELNPHYQGRVAFAILDVLENIELAREYEVRYLPTLLFVDAAGNVVAVHGGFMPRADLIAILDSGFAASPSPSPIALVGLGGLIASFAGGLVSTVNPCVLGSLFLLIGYIGSYGGGRRRVWFWAAAFAAGTVVAFTALGLVAAEVGSFLGLVSRRWYLLLAAIMAWMGLQTLRVLPGPAWATPGPAAAKSGRGTWLALLLGGLAAIILSPCATPVLIAILGLAASRGGGEAVALLFAYGLGRAVPLVALGISTELFGRIMARRDVGRWADAGRTALGIGILLIAVYFIYLGV